MISNVVPMNTAELVDPQLLPLVQAAPPADLTNIPVVRKALLEQFSTPDEQSFTVRTAKGRNSAPDIELYVFNAGQTKAKRPAVLHFHGGGMVAGSARMASFTVPAIVQAVNAVVVSAEYRLAPEVSFPDPQEDCYAALAWLFEHAEELGADRDRIVLMGESAGGGLAAALALMARDRGEYRLKGQVLIFPMLDHRTGGEEDRWRNPTTGEFVWTRTANQIGWKALQGDYTLDDERKSWFSPALAEDLSGLPATYIAVGALDLFLDENLDYARCLSACGTPVDMNIYAGAPHGFQLAAGTDVALRADADLRAALQRLAAL